MTGKKEVRLQHAHQLPVSMIYAGGEKAKKSRVIDRAWGEVPWTSVEET